MAKPTADWRKIEAALIDLLREEGFEITQDRGDSFITVLSNHKLTTVCVGDFAKELEKRL